jgi:hypothetical protein
MDTSGLRTVNSGAGHAPILSALSQRLHVLVDAVDAIYTEELARLAAHARIHSFLNVLALRHTREILRDLTQRCSA